MGQTTENGTVTQALPGICLAWLIPAILLLNLTGPSFWANGPTGTDDLMRLVQVRDLIAGQGWFDLTQNRMGLPFGVEMHWSRLVDAPIAGLILLAKSFGFHANAENFALTVWPLALMFILIFGLGVLSNRLLGLKGTVTALAYSAMAVSALTYFAPGRIDHHNLQMVLLVSMLALAVSARANPKFAVGAGICAAGSLAVGLENLPYVGVVGFWFAVIWAQGYGEVGEKITEILRNFGFAFAGGSAAFFVATVSSMDFKNAACDTFSLAYLAPALIVGAGFAALSIWTEEFSNNKRKFFGLAFLGVATCASVGFINLSCLRGPYAELDTALVDSWLNSVQEAKGFSSLFLESPGFAYGLIAAPLIGLASGLYASFHAEKFRTEWQLLTGALFIAVLLSLLQMRAASFANVLAILPCAWLTISIGDRLRRHQPAALSGVIFVFVWLAGMNVSHALLGAKVIGPKLSQPKAGDTPHGRQSSCKFPNDLQPLLSIKQGRIFNEIDLGPAILAHTNHNVVSGPYHRGKLGLREGILGFAATSDQNKDAIWARNSDYIVFCADGAQARLNKVRPNSMMRQLIAGNIPDWLVPVPTADNSHLLIFRIRKEQLGPNLKFMGRNP